MGVEILSRTISSVVDKRVKITNGQIARLLAIGSTWNKIRIGCLMAFDGSATIASGTPRFALGVCNGTANTVGDATTNHFLGFYTNSSSWTYASGPPATFGSVITRHFKKVGSTITDPGVTNNGVYYSSAPASIRQAFFMQIDKGSPNFTVGIGHPSTAAGAQTDISLAKFTEIMELDTDLSQTGTVQSGYTGSTMYGGLAIDETTDGVFNAVNLWWDRTGVPCEVAYLAYRRVA